jgi:hypothetical protein
MSCSIADTPRRSDTNANKHQSGEKLSYPSRTSRVIVTTRSTCLDTQKTDGSAVMRDLDYSTVSIVIASWYEYKRSPNYDEQRLETMALIK